ncbi:endolytic transglycosylase MltG [Pelagibacteraceae bacterium]|nr:endolytic transglycosylase MltG [Pelagibacteraceae bacterium]
MDLEEQILRYYLKAFSFTFIICTILFFFYILYLFNKNIEIKKNPISINKGDNIDTVLTSNIVDVTTLEITLVKIYIKINNYINKTFIHFGDFSIQSNSSLRDFLKIISKPSNVLLKITIVEGWSQKQLNLELSKYFKNFHTIPYQDIIADTYYFNKNTDFNSFLSTLHNFKRNYFKKYRNNELNDKFNVNELMIIGSLLEKEGLDEEDKKQISSVIFNRLDRKMKLQIDATVLFAITNGKYDLNRKLLRSDLKINHPFNTYIYIGLPPEPISYVGKNSLDILFENNKNDFLFYFFNYSLNKHIFSKSFKEHKEKLYEYRKK